MLDTTTGLVSFPSAPGNGVAITADFQFDVPVRFDTDRLAATIDSYGSRSWHDIPIVEIRVYAYSLTKGCDKTITTCFSRFNNVVNFRGEPLVPGLDRMLETAGTRSAF